MQNPLVIILVIALIVAVVAIVWLYSQKRRTEQLRERFGPEYDRAVDNSDSTRRAEAELERRERRVEQLDIHPLSAEQSSEFADRWRSAQAQFVDDPSGAIREADRLVGEVMQARGYPMGDFEQRAADVSVDHPDVVSNYRAAHAIALKNERDGTSTEDLRQAMVYYRSLFEDLLEPSSTAQRGTRP
jgi:hypothetical protein